MESVKENGGSFGVDLNENENGELGDLGGPKSLIKDALIAVKGHVYLTGNGRSGNVNTDDENSDKVILERIIFPTDSTGDGGEDHGGLNGFTESFGPFEGVVSGGFEGEGDGLASCPTAGLHGLVSQAMVGESGESKESKPNSDVDSRGEEPTDTADEANHAPLTVETHQPGLCSSPDQQNCECTTANNTTTTDSALDLCLDEQHTPNGDVDGDGDVDVDVDSPERESSSPISERDFGEEVKEVNGGFGFNIVTKTREPWDLWPDESEYNSSENINDTDFHFEPSAKQENVSGCQSDCSETLVEDAPPAPASLSHDPPTFPGSKSAKLPNGEIDPEPTITRNHDYYAEDTDDFTDFISLPVRPQTLRTNNPNLTLSLSCDATPLSPHGEEEGANGFYYEGYEEDFRASCEAGRRKSAPDNLPDLTEQTDGSTDPKMMPKRFGIADFFTRSLFTRKSKEPKALSHNATGWRLFGKTPAAQTASDVTTTESTEPETTVSRQQSPQEETDSDLCLQTLSAQRRKNLEFEPLSTTALILEDRPSNLPAKSVEETQRHKMEYEEMVAGAKRRELKEAQKKKRQMKERHRQEDNISNAMITWNTEILPHWDNVKCTRRVRELWWQGLPPSVRGRVWSLAIGNELNITPELYEIFLSRAKEKWRSYSETSSVNDSESDGGASLADRESSLDLIKLDISRTFPSLFIFQKGGPYHDLLHSVLGAYTCYRPDIGYVQGMSFIAAVLILNLEEAEAFITFANLLNKPCQMAFFRVDHDLMLKYFAAFEVFFEENLPRLFSHFQTNNLTPDLYLIDWIFTLYSKSLALDVACRVWDVFCRDGEESLFRTGLGILRLYEEVLLQMDFIHMAQFLTRLPEDLQAHTLFTAMSHTHMMSRNRRWGQVFAALMKEGTKETDKNNSPALRS